MDDTMSKLLLTEKPPRGAAPADEPSVTEPAFPLGTRVRNTRTDELATIVAPTPGAYIDPKSISTVYDDDDGTIWQTLIRNLEIVEEEIT
jgi:hypothetical protein